jgi:hypothetical protein
MKKIFLTLFTLALVAVGPLIFPMAQSGHGNLATLAINFLLPSIGILAAAAVFIRRSETWLSLAILRGGLAGRSPPARSRSIGLSDFTSVTYQEICRG